MRTLDALLAGFSVALTLKNLLWGFLGVTLGTAVGVLPGVGPALTIAPEFSHSSASAKTLTVTSFCSEFKISAALCFS